LFRSVLTAQHLLVESVAVVLVFRNDDAPSKVGVVTDPLVQEVHLVGLENRVLVPVLQDLQSAITGLTPVHLADITPVVLLNRATNLRKALQLAVRLLADLLRAFRALFKLLVLWSNRLALGGQFFPTKLFIFSQDVLLSENEDLRVQVTQPVTKSGQLNL